MTFKRAWIASVVGYAVARAVAAWGLFGAYGVNPWIFAVIDIGTAVPYASAIAELPNAVAESNGRLVLRHGAIAIASFVAPYVYIWAVADKAPRDLHIGLVLLVVCLFGATLIGVGRGVKQARLPATQNGSSSIPNA